MDVAKQVNYWRQGAEEAWNSARCLIDDNHTGFGLFAAHLALEKTLKAHVSQKTEEMAPKTHNLLRLATLSGLTFTAQQIAILGDMDLFQIEGRYPETLPFPPSRLEAEAIMARAKDVFSWLMQQLSPA